LAKRPESAHTDIDWIYRDRRVIDGLDHIGVELISVNLYQAMLPGITNVTERARYYSFYPWCIHRYAQEGPTERTRANWVRWLRAVDFAYAASCIAHDQQVGNASGSAVVGGDRASDLLKGKALSAAINLQAASAVSDKGKVEGPGAYFKNPQGGFGQYYRGPLRDMAVVVEHEPAAWPDVSLSNYAGLQIANEVDKNSSFRDLVDIADEGRATVEELARVGASVHPDAIEPKGREESILRRMFLGTDPELCRGQAPQQLHWRSTSLRLMLDYLERSDLIEESPDYEFRWACLARALPDGSLWTCPPGLAEALGAWGAYQRNDALNYCLECLMGVVLDLLEDGPLRPLAIAGQVADLAMAPISASQDSSALPALTGRVSSWITACERSARDQHADPWGEMSTWQWTDRLETARGEADLATICGLAARLLGRLATDRGGTSSRPFSAIPGATEMAQGHDIHLEQWWRRVDGASGEPIKDFLIQLVIEWIVFRHLRVATRKLAGQGVSTFKFRPEEGRLVLVADRLPRATFTAPRVRQGYRILADLRLVKKSDDGWTITADGSRAIES
jgi:hypothetical protein